MARRLVVLLVSLIVASPAFAFQVYGGSRRMNPAYKTFKFYITSTYYDYASDGQLPITAIHIDGVTAALKILAEKSDVEGLSFEYAGTYEYASLSADQRIADSDAVYDHAIFFDFTSNDFWGRDGFPTAGGAGKMSPSSEGLRAGGLVQMNSDYLNFIHPDVNMASIVMHETLHIFGLDHSTTSSSVMAYTEFWYPTLSADDVIGLRQIYGGGPDTSVQVTTTLSSAPAPGVEVVLIDPALGTAVTVIADHEAVALVKHLEPKDYIIGVRELTPTGPCFEEPTRGFLTTFVAVSGVTNDPSLAKHIAVAAGAPVEITIPLIPGVKKFDCHFGRATALSDAACNASSFNPPTGNENCYLHMTKPGTHYEMLGENDVSLTHHKTVTDINDAAHARIEMRAFGSEQHLSFLKYAIDPEFDNYQRIELDVGANTAFGVQAALCTADGEFALVSSFIEVQEFGGALTNKLLLPQHAEELENYRGDRNYGQHIRPGETPGSGARPPNVKGSGGVGGAGAGAGGDDSGQGKEKKKWYQCGVVDASAARFGYGLLFVFLLPLLLVGVKSRGIGKR